MNFTRYILPLAILALPCAVSAQDLHKEITVEQEIVPTKRDASRIMLHPAVTLPPLKASSLAFSDRTVTTEVPNSLTILEPVAWGDRLYSSPYKGYVDLGLGGPLYNGLVSAGYRILDDDRTRLSIWGQYDGSIYKRDEYSGTDNKKWKNHTATAGIDLHRAVGTASFIDAGLDYTYSTHTVPCDMDTYTAPANRFNASAVFHSEAGGLAYAAGLTFRRFAFGRQRDLPEWESNTQRLPNLPSSESPVYNYPHTSENLFKLTLDGSIASSDNSRAGLDVDASFLRSSDFYNLVYPYRIDNFEWFSGKTTGLITLTPYWHSRTDKVSLRIGADVDIAFKSGNAFRFSPDVTFAWTPAQVFGLELKAHGGSRLNPLSSLYDITPYLSTVAAYTEMSRIPYAFDGKITLGRFLGTFLEISGGYAKADRWLMAATGDYYPGGAGMFGVDLKGWHFGVAAGYDNGRNFSLKASWETAPSKFNRAYYEWRDRARHVVNASLALRPVRPLLLEATYEFRTGRCEYAFEDQATEILGSYIYVPIRRSLKAVSDLSIGASYEFNSAVTFFARGENLMNRRWYHLGAAPSQGLHGLVGVGVKF